MLWLAMTPDTRGASALSVTGNHNLTCLLSGTYLFEPCPWILHSIRHKGLLLFQINLLIGDTNSPIMPAISVPFPGCSPYCPFLHKLQYPSTHNSQHGSYCRSFWELGPEFGSSRL